MSDAMNLAAGDMYDVAIVGFGPSGSVAASLLGQAGRLSTDSG